MTEPVVSVVVCTRNRAGYLRTLLESLGGQSIPDAPFEVLVVDNGSTDDTPAVVRAFADALPLRSVSEPTPGLQHARNAGWQAARGRIVAYLDDDAVAQPGWLAAAHAAFVREPRAGIVGGRILPIWEAPRPVWLSEMSARALTIVDWPGGPKRVADVRREWFAGANMAMPRAVLAEVGGFHPALDRMGDNMLSNGDIHVQYKIVARGYAAVYEPAMAVRHAVTPERLTKAWFRRRYFWQGISDVVMNQVDDRPSSAECVRAAARHALELLRSPARLRALLLPTDDAERFTEKCMAQVELGRIAGLLRAARQ